ncbi:hypothetical protein C8T65DRAFT_736260 [Cerioporus squamosus]|nr:hypothetical protein C8T65DRAFT_736260 [Cerioporus squamosus]
MSFSGSTDAALAAELLQTYIQGMVEESRDKLERVLLLKSGTILKLATISQQVRDSFGKVSLQQKRKTASLLRSEAAYYRSRREKSKTAIIGQIRDMYGDTDLSLRDVQDYYGRWSWLLPVETRADIDARLTSLKTSQGYLKRMEDTVCMFFDGYGDALSILGLPKDEFVQATESLLYPSSTVTHMRSAEPHIDTLRAAWIADDAALQRVSDVLVQARREMRYDAAVAELVKIKEDVDTTALRFHVAVDGIKAISMSIDGPSTLTSATFLNGRTISVQKLLCARTRFNGILDCIEGCRKDVKVFCRTAQILLETIQDAVRNAQPVRAPEVASA